MDWKEVSRKMQEKGEKMQESGKNMQKAGGKLTLKLTIPIVLFALLGWLGLILGILIVILSNKKA